MCNTLFTFSSIPIDYNLYRKFWTLQDYFRNPVQCYDKFSWMTFLKVTLPEIDFKRIRKRKGLQVNSVMCPFSVFRRDVDTVQEL